MYLQATKRKMIPRYGNHMSLNTIVMVLKLAANKETELLTMEKRKETDVLTWVTFCF